MKILIDHSSPFLLAHGGVQRQIEETKGALERAGVQIEYLRWWHEDQKADLIHFFGAIPYGYLSIARRKGIPVILTSFFSSTCNRTKLRLRVQGILTRLILALPIGGSVKAQLQWQAYREASHHIVGLEAEARVLKEVYGVSSRKITIMPLGLGEQWSEQTAKRNGDYLITVGTIYDVKRAVPLARMALEVKVPILFVGSPYSTNDPYWKEFLGLVDEKYVRHFPHQPDSLKLAALYSEARGFVLYSQFENWSLAAHEAAGMRLPLLLPDLAWSRECFGSQAFYFGEAGKTHAESLKQFYDSAPDATAPIIPQASWDEVAARLSEVYRQVLAPTSASYESGQLCAR